MYYELIAASSNVEEINETKYISFLDIDFNKRNVAKNLRDVTNS